MTASTLAALHVARLIASARDELSAIIGPLGAHWTWRAAQWAAEDAELWQRPHAVAATVAEESRGRDAGAEGARVAGGWEAGSVVLVKRNRPPLKIDRAMLICTCAVPRTVPY